MSARIFNLNFAPKAEEQYNPDDCDIVRLGGNEFHLIPKPPIMVVEKLVAKMHGATNLAVSAVDFSKFFLPEERDALLGFLFDPANGVTEEHYGQLAQLIIKSVDPGYTPEQAEGEGMSDPLDETSSTQPSASSGPTSSTENSAQPVPSTNSVTSPSTVPSPGSARASTSKNGRATPKRSALARGN